MFFRRFFSGGMPFKYTLPPIAGIYKLYALSQHIKDIRNYYAEKLKCNKKEPAAKTFKILAY